MLSLAASRAQEGDRLGAIELYRALAKDPARVMRAEARSRLARLLADQGKLAEAAAELRQLVDEDPRAGAVRIGLAQLLDRMGDIDGARRQLRAAQASGLPRELGIYGERYANSLRSRAPYGSSVEMALAPDNNINRATRSETLSTVIGDFEIDPGSKARSGLGIAVAGAAFARFSISDDVAWVTRLQANTDRFRDTAFNRLNFSLSTGAEWSPGKARVAIDAAVGRSTFGGKPHQSFRQASVRAYRPFGSRTAATANVSAAKIDNRLNDLQDGRSLSAGVAIDRAVSPEAGVQLSLSLSKFTARDPGYSTRSGEVGLGGWLDVGRWTFTAGLAHGKLNADKRLFLFPARRQDDYNKGTVGIEARQIQLLGFSPFARFTIERNKSSVQIWDFSRRRFELGAKRAF